MKKPQVLFHQGDDFQSQGLGKFLKDVAVVGNWLHPVTGQEIVMTRERINNLYNWTEKYRQNVDKKVIPFPDGHTFKASENLGDCEQFFAQGDRLYAVVQPRGKDVEEKLASKKIRSVSPYIEFNVKDSFGNVYPEVITHVAATPYPVQTGQEDFIAMSAKDEAFEFYIPEAIALSNGGSDVLKTHDALRKELQDHMKAHKAALDAGGADHPDTKKAAMKVQDAASRLRRQAEVVHSHVNNATGGPTYLSTKTEGISPEGILEDPKMSKKLALALGLPEDATAEAIEAAALKAGKDQKAFSALSAQIEKDFGLKVEGEKAVKLSATPAVPTTDLEKSQAAELAQLKASNALSAAKDAAKKVDAMVKSGVVPPAKQEILSRLLSIPGKAQALALSKDGKALEEIQANVAADVEELLKDLPGIGTQRLSAQTDDEKKAEELSTKKIDEVATRIQPELAAKK
jgi:hypothetical protein